ncbi:MAG: penicillin-binding protein 2 [Candidatus Promineifilaceae bacterium]|nr:penicillin-binding protein 2 [Candidatus Promineifilaceae bacterium]
MDSHQKRRLWIVIIGMIAFTVVLVVRLVRFQILQGEEFAENAPGVYQFVEKPIRGAIFDRNGAILAANGADYQIGASPDMVTEPQELAVSLASILQDEQVYQLKAKLQSNYPYVVVAGRVTQETADSIRNIPYEGLQIEPLPRRFYPQGNLLSHTLGYVDLDGKGLTGIEGYYNRELAGVAALREYSISPLDPPEEVAPNEGADLVLTIDRTVQFTVEEHLREAIKEYEAESGVIIVMDPRTGAILAMASEPSFDPYTYFDTDADKLQNPIVSKQFEPGSVIKLITMAAALDSGVVTPESTYLDNGELFVGGHKTVNWTRQAHGVVDMTTLLAQSLNVGAATLALWMGTDTYYDYMQNFGFGRPTGIDILAEAGGLMPLPGDPLWEESFLATNSYGQSLATTPLQMITAISALANDGKMMQPYVVQEIHRNGEVYVHKPNILSEPVSKEAAEQVTAMAINALSTAIPQAAVPGYTVAGKTGTAQIAENGIYLTDAVIGTFAGYLPADDPEITVYVKLDRPEIPWGSQTAAPTFSALARDLVVLLDIPPDSIRLDGEVMAARASN